MKKILESVTTGGRIISNYRIFMLIIYKLDVREIENTGLSVSPLQGNH